MAKRLNNVLGVDIGSQTIKIAEVRMQGRQPNITAIGIAQTPEGAVDHVGINDPESVATILKQLCGASGVSISDAVVSIAGQGAVLVRTLEVPSMNEAELKQHMDWEITRNIPFAESNVVSDFAAFDPESDTAPNMEVVMAISPQSAVEGVVHLIKKAGKKPAAIDVEPLGLARSLVASSETELRDKSVCLVEIGHKTTSINVYRNGRLLMPRQVPLGGEQFTRAIADALNVSIEEAQEIKHNKARIPASAAAAPSTFQAFDPMEGFGEAEPPAAPAPAETQSFAPYNPFAEEEAPAAFATVPPEATADVPHDSFEVAPPMAEEAAPEPSVTMPEPEPQPFEPPPVATTSIESTDLDSETQAILGAIAPILDELVAEVRRSVDYFRSKGGEVDLVAMCGGGSKLKGLGAFVKTSVGIEVVEHDPLKGINIGGKKVDMGMVEPHKAEYAIAVGNGLYGFF